MSPFGELKFGNLTAVYDLGESSGGIGVESDFNDLPAPYDKIVEDFAKNLDIHKRVTLYVKDGVHTVATAYIKRVSKKSAEYWLGILNGATIDLRVGTLIL